MLALQVINAYGRGKASVAFGTVINTLIPGDPHGYTYLTFARYTAAGTAHTLTIMRGQTHAKAAAAAAAAAVAVVVDTAMLDGAGNALAAGDFVGVELSDGSWHLGIVDTSGWDSTTKTITLTSGTAIPAGKTVAAGGAVVSFGVAGDANHANYTLTAPASATTNYPAVDGAGVLAKSPVRNSPILVQSSNATATGTIEQVAAVYAKR